MTFFHFYLDWQFVLILIFSFTTKWLSFENRVHCFCSPPLVMNPLLSASNFVNSFLISDSSWKDRFSPNSWQFEFSAYQSIFCRNLLMEQTCRTPSFIFVESKAIFQKAEKKTPKQRPNFSLLQFGSSVTGESALTTLFSSHCSKIMGISRSICLSMSFYFVFCMNLKSMTYPWWTQTLLLTKLSRLRIKLLKQFYSILFQLKPILLEYGS